MRHSTVYDA